MNSSLTKATLAFAMLAGIALAGCGGGGSTPTAVAPGPTGASYTVISQTPATPPPGTVLKSGTITNKTSAQPSTLYYSVDTISFNAPNGFPNATTHPLSVTATVTISSADSLARYGSDDLSEQVYVCGQPPATRAPAGWIASTNDTRGPDIYVGHNGPSDILVGTGVLTFADSNYGGGGSYCLDLAMTSGVNSYVGGGAPISYTVNYAITQP